MKLLLENWRKYINENTTVEDYNFIITQKPNLFTIEAVNYDFEPVISKSGGNKSFYQLKKEREKKIMKFLLPIPQNIQKV